MGVSYERKVQISTYRTPEPKKGNGKKKGSGESLHGPEVSRCRLTVHGKKKAMLSCLILQCPFALRWMFYSSLVRRFGNGGVGKPFTGFGNGTGTLDIEK